MRRAAGRALTPDLRGTGLVPNATAVIVGIERRWCTLPDWRGLMTRTQKILALWRRTRGENTCTVVASYLHRYRPLLVVHPPPRPLAGHERHSFRRLPAASCSYVGFAYRTVDAFVADPPKNDELDDDLAFAESLPPLLPPPEEPAASFF